MKLNQVIAVEKGQKTRLEGEIDAAYKLIQKPALFEGQDKVYAKKDDKDADQPPQRQKVQVKGNEVVKGLLASLSALFDITAQKDFANCDAKADVKVGDVVIAPAVPATFLLFLSKRLTDLQTVVGKVPTLDASQEWKLDKVVGLHRTEPVMTNRTEKVQKALVLYPATEKHPAQTQLITDDVVVGTWNLTRSSGALTEAQKTTLLSRINTLAVAVKKAREEANLTPAPERPVGDKILAFILEGGDA